MSEICERYGLFIILFLTKFCLFWNGKKLYKTKYDIMKHCLNPNSTDL